MKDFQNNWLPGKINGLQGSSVRGGALCGPVGRSICWSLWCRSVCSYMCDGAIGRRVGPFLYWSVFWSVCRPCDWRPLRPGRVDRSVGRCVTSIGVYVGQLEETLVRLCIGW